MAEMLTWLRPRVENGVWQLESDDEKGHGLQGTRKAGGSAEGFGVRVETGKYVCVKKIKFLCFNVWSVGIINESLFQLNKIGLVCGSTEGPGARPE